MLSLTDSAQNAVARFMEGAEEPVTGLRISVTGDGCSGMQYAMALEAEAKDDDSVIECGTVKIFVDPMSAPMLSGVTVDFLDSMEGRVLSLSIPTPPPAVVVVRLFPVN